MLYRRAARRLGLLTLVFSVVVISEARGQTQDPWTVEHVHGEIGLFGGVLRASNDHELFNAGAGIEQRRYEAWSPDFGVRLAFYPASVFGLEVEGAAMPTQLRTGSGDARLYRLSGHGVLQYPGRFSPFVLAGASAYGVQSDDDVQGDDTDIVFHWGLGAKMFLTRWFALRVDGRHIVAPSLASGSDDNISHHFEILGGLTFAFGRHPSVPDDTDKDGVVDPLDKCVKTPGIQPDGCPDSDGDGISDPRDRCPKVQGDDANGCPLDADQDGVADVDDKCPTEAASTKDGCPVKDSDGDGIFDDKDACINEAGTLANGCPDPDPDKDGVVGDADKCPTVASGEPDGCPAQDRDKDGVVDGKDKCPDQPGKGSDGCPLDSDGDGVIDDFDQCVDQPETNNGYQDADGCPDEVPVAVKKFTGAIAGITFQRGRARIAPASFPVLDKAVAVLKEYPELKLEVGGHTDSSGPARVNERLSQQRADAVAAYLVRQGIDADRVTAVGYGEREPAAPNSTRAGRAKNRRIEFKLRQ